MATDTKSTKALEIESVTIRFCGDSGDGMQLTGSQFTTTSALVGNDISTYPNFPAEIRAPQGTLAGVSGFQIHFSSNDIYTAGDALDVLVAMNPAALKTNISDLKQNGILIVNEDSFNEVNYKKAGYPESVDALGPLKSKYTVYEIPFTKLVMTALEDSSLASKAKEKCKNLFALGLMYFIYSRPLEPTIKWLEQKFGNKPDVFDANVKALKAGFNFGDTCEMFQNTFIVPKASIAPGSYRNVTGNEALSIGLVTASELTGRPLFIGSYPITPATEVLQELNKYKHYGVKSFQAEDEIAGIGTALGAAFAGHLAVTTTSGPGICLKSEFMNLAVMTELPLIICDIQRGGPSTGLPTKQEQTDLLQVLFGRNGESPMPVIAASSPSDCFDTAIEAARIATQFMTPVVVLSDTQVGIGSEPWKLPDIDSLPNLEVHFTVPSADDVFMPYARNELLARNWAIPGTPYAEHTLGGLEKENITGKINLSAEVHDQMTKLRAEKIANIAKTIPATEVFGQQEGDLLLIGWGSTYGALRSATEELLKKGHKVGQVHIKHLNPLPRDLGDILKRFSKVAIAELNLGQLLMLVRSKYLVDAKGINQVNTKPFAVADLIREAEALLK